MRQSRRPIARAQLRRLAVALVTLGLLLASPLPLLGHESEVGQSLDPAFETPLPCEAVSTPGLVPRSAKNLAHLANVCGFVGTDVEFQSRVAVDGSVHDYAFVGTMGAGMRIFDVTDPTHPQLAGAYLDPGWQNDVQVRGDTAVIAFDPVVVGVHASACLRGKQPNGVRQGGVDVVRLSFDPATATFTTSLVDCYVVQTPNNGAHNSTLHPSGDWLAINTTQTGVEVVDLRSLPVRMVRKIPASVTGSAHDTSFSADGSTLYAASPGTGTYIVDVSNALEADPTQIAFIPNVTEPGGTANPRNLTTSHQADVSSDGRVLVFTDERGGGLSNTACNTDPDAVIGGMHFWSVADPGTPTRMGSWFYPNPGLAVDALEPVLASIGRSERGCTIHVFRNGGNGTTGPGAAEAGFDGVSSLPADQAVSAHYGAGVWWIDYGAAPTDDDGTPEHPMTDWGNTLGWNVMPGADTWSAKEYKGFVYAGDMTRGFDVYAFSECEDLGCAVVPANTPGSASGGGQLAGQLGEFTILRGTAVGGRAQFGFDVDYLTGATAPTGTVTFRDRDSGVRVEATSISTLTIEGPRATMTGRATVDGTPGVAFFLEVEDLGKAGADTFRIVTGTGYGAFGVVEKGNITVSGGGLLGIGPGALL
ncbi:MAG TPA: post-COAP-1 domain-containing protein [Candidatus Limnocylindria bacterium]|nr:post-COAP-1 domain-containing protein [Candidatus Limnocylindria bacterium]